MGFQLKAPYYPMVAVYPLSFPSFSPNKLDFVIVNFSFFSFLLALGLQGATCTADQWHGMARQTVHPERNNVFPKTLHNSQK